MNPIQILIIGLAIALNSFVAYLTAGYVLQKEPVTKMLSYGFFMLVTQSLMIAAGLWLGVRIGVLASNSNYYIAAGILLLMGLKVIFESLRIKPEDKTFDLSETRVLIMLSIAEGITPMIISIAIGLTVETIFPSWSILVITQSLALISGLVFGTRYGKNALRLRVGPVGGLILLAASLKLLIDLIGF